MASYDKWRRRLAGEKVLTAPDPDENDIGFYRKPITEKGKNAKTGHPNGKTKIIGWEPVAYYMAEGMLCGRIGDRDMTGDEVIDTWTWVCRYPISEEMYRDVAEMGKPWPDAPLAEIPAANRDVALTHNAPPIEIVSDKAHAEAIDAAIGAAIKTVTSEAEAAQALGSKNRIAELRLAADKAGKAIYEPIYREYKRVQGVYAPIVRRAEDEEKRLNTSILTYRESERKRIAKDQAEAIEKQRLIDEANARAADRAIARGEPEPLPVVEEVAAPIAPAPIAPAPIVATYGTRKLKEEIHLILEEVTDYDAVYQFLKAEPKVQALLLELARAKVKAGFAVPGTTTREGLI